MRSLVVVFACLMTVAAFADTATSGSSSSQTVEMSARSRSAVRLGILGGLNLGNVGLSNGIRTTSADERTGMAGGIFADFSLNDYLSLQPELMYVQKGSSSGSSVLRLDYLELPVLVKGKFGSDTARFVVMGGPSIALALKRQAANTITNLTADVSDQIKSIDLGIQAGIGGEFDVSSAVSLFINARYMQGLLDIDNTASTVTASTRGFLFLTGAAFSL